ncbi:MAG TPA: hypothetical protein VKE40_01595, partial [Gemmataceae bacterium]|nr:hypothetical protein [Gemmataceae bacterium]
MKSPLLLLAAAVATHAAAADPPPIPDRSIAQKKELLFADDFEGAEPARQWHKVVPSFTFEKGTLKGTQTRDKDMPSADGKSVVKAHAAVHGLDVP